MFLSLEIPPLLHALNWVCPHNRPNKNLNNWFSFFFRKRAWLVHYSTVLSRYMKKILP
jgi:hypothetical protein